MDDHKLLQYVAAILYKLTRVRYREKRNLTYQASGKRQWNKKSKFHSYLIEQMYSLESLVYQ